MPKTETITIRLDPIVKKNAEAVLKKLGLTLAQAVTIFFVQVSLKKGLPFAIEIPKDDVPIDTEDLSMLAPESLKDHQGK